MSVLLSVQGFAVVQEWRPLRSFFAKMDPIADQEKRMAARIPAGWVIISDTLVGPYDDKYVTAFSLKEKSSRWWVKLDYDVTNPLAAHGQYVILGLRDGALLKVDSGSGEIVWRTTIGSYAARETVLSGSTLLVVSVRQEVYALDFQTGELKWFYEAGVPEEVVVSGMAPPVADGRVVYVGVNSGEIHAISIDSGQLLWKKDPQFSTARFMDVVGRMMVSNGKLYITRYDGVLASMLVGGAEAEIEWLEKTSNIMTSAFRDGRLYVGTLNGDVIAYELVSGRQVWKFSTGEAVSSLSVLQDMIVSVGSKGRIIFLDLDQGKMKWGESLEGAFSATPGIYEGSLLIFSGLGSVYGYKF